MALSFGLHTQGDTRCMHLGSPLVSFGWAPIDSRLRQNTTSHGLDRVCQLFRLQEIDTEERIIFRCLIYYEIKGKYYFLFPNLGRSLSTFFRYLDHKCISFFAREGFRDIYKPLYVLFQPEAFKTITSYFPSHLIGATSDRWRFMILSIPA